MRKVRDILRLAWGQGLSHRVVGAALGVPFTTVADHLRRAKAVGLSWPLPEDLSDAALEALLFDKEPAPPTQARPMPDWQYIHKELRRPGVTLMLLWLEYKEAHPSDGYAYSQFCRHYRAFEGHLDLVMRQEHRAGEKLFVDFPGQRLAIYDRRTGEVALWAELFVAEHGHEQLRPQRHLTGPAVIDRQPLSGEVDEELLTGQRLAIYDRRTGEVALWAELFVAVLGASNYLYAEAVASQELISWVGAHVHAFESCGSVPRIVVCDNLRSGVTKAHRYEPEINATYQEMAAHYGVA